MINLNIHLVSDFTCDTLMSISSVIGSQFPEVKIKRIFHQFVRNIDQVDNIVKSLNEEPGIVLFSLLSDDIELKITDIVSTMPNCRVIPVMDYLISEFSSHLNIKSEKIKRTSNLSNDYFARMDAMRFTINHDDGRMTDNIDDADIILIGVSRTSKSPTSIYLAHKGYRVANIPFVTENLMPSNLLNCKHAIIIGLNIEPERLIWLRESRMQTDGIGGFNMQYNNSEDVIQELREFRRYCGKLGCNVIDVTQKSVEEVSAYIFNIIQKNKIDI